MDGKHPQAWGRVGQGFEVYVFSPALGTMLRSLDTNSSNNRVSYESMNVGTPSNLTV